MNCDEVRDLLPAYVLGALDAEELEAVEEHLRAGSEHEEELVELRATVFALDRFGDELEPSESFEAATLAIDGSRGGRRIQGIPAWLLGAAAVVLVAVFGAGWLASELLGSGQDLSIQIYGTEGRHLFIDGTSGDETVTVTMAGFDMLPEAQAYQLWAIRDGEWQTIGVCNTNERGWWKGDFAFEVQSGEQVAVTVEPTSGSEKPTSEPVLISGR